MPHGKPTITERPSFPSLLISRQSQRSTSSVASTSAEVTVAPSSVAGADTSGNAIFAPDVRDDYGNDHAEGRGQSPTPDLSERLRDQLKSTEQRRRAQSNTSRGSSQSRTATQGPISTATPQVEDVSSRISVPQDSLNGALAPRKYFVLTAAGKPVYASGLVSKDDEELLTTTVGVIQAIISIFADEDDKLRYIDAGQVRIAFLLRSPLYFAAVSEWGEPESILRAHLEYLHLHILSIVSQAQLQRFFSQRHNFDLRRILEGASSMLDHLVVNLQTDFSLVASSLEVLRLDPKLREEIGDVLTPKSKPSQDLLYALVICKRRVVTLLRPKRHSIHPSDLHILLNTVFASSSLTAPGSESWIPICLPRFNPNGFLHALVSFIHKDLGMIVVSANKEEFFAMKAWKDAITQRITNSSILKPLLSAGDKSEYSLGDISVPGVRHFIYKSRTTVQVTRPAWQGIYEETQHQRRVLTLYQRISDLLHTKQPASGQGRQPAKLVFFQTEHEGVLGWITSTFEVYIALGPLLPKTAAVTAAHGVLRWVQSKEAELFLVSAPSF